MKTLVLITAFNVEKFLEDVVMRIPKEIKSYNPEILIINDFSRDNTLQKMREIKGNFKDFKVTCLTNKTNLGYGGNQKLGYHYAIKNNFDYVVMLHGDGQYAPESIIDMIKPLAENKCSAVQGSRMIKKIPNAATAICSGWMHIRGNRRWKGVDAGFSISDHADWDGLLEAVKATGAEKVHVTHGSQAVFSKYLNEIGIEAYELKTEFGEDEFAKDEETKTENA